MHFRNCDRSERYDDSMKLHRASSLLCIWLAGSGLLVGDLAHPGVARAGGAKGDAGGGAGGKLKGWVDYEAPEGLYKAKFPAAPQAEKTKDVPSYVIARYQTVGGLNAGPMYYVAAMVGKSQNTPPPDMLPGLLTVAEKQGFQSLGVKVSDSKPMKDAQGNPGRKLQLTHPGSHRSGIGKIIANRLTGALLLVAGFGPDAEAFVKTAQFL
jgi:hypothetical protein